MTHARTTIRDRITTILTGLPITGSNVFAARVKPLADSQLPAIVVNTLSEEMDLDESTFQSGVLKQWRVLEVQTVVLSRKVDGDTIATELDDIAEDIENALYADKTLGISVKETIYSSTAIVMEPESDAPRGEMIITFKISYRVAESAIGTIIS